MYIFLTYIQFSLLETENCKNKTTPYFLRFTEKYIQGKIMNGTYNDNKDSITSIKFMNTYTYRCTFE